MGEGIDLNLKKTHFTRRGEMKIMREEIDRRTFLKTTAAVGAGVAFTGLMNDLVWGKSLPDDEIADLPLFQLSKMIRNGEISSKRLVEIYLDRIEKFGGRDKINCYITVAADSALKQAEELDKLTKEKEFKGPLHGLPIALKDNIDTKEIRTTGGSKILASWYPPADAHVVQKLKQAGAIILGKANMHEFAFGVTNNNPHYGPVRNPYDFSKIPGGSSGGSAAATAAALCAASLGSDTGGSVRIPAALCGIVGLKPTLGRVGRGGVIPLSFTRDCVGPMTRTVMDAAMVLEVIAGKDPRDPESTSNPVPRYTRLLRGDLRGKRFGVPKKFISEVIHPDTQKVMDESLREIQKMGGVIKEIEIRHIELEYAADFNVVIAEAIYLVENYLKRFDPQATIDKYLDEMGPDVRGVLGSQKGTPESKPVPGYVYVKTLREECVKVTSGFEEALSNVDALLFPTTPLPASKIGEDVETELQGEKVSIFLTYIRNCVPLSVAGYPAISVPAGYSQTGLPIGLEIVARPWEEDKLLSMAYAYEQATKSRKPPKL
jgi:Asp-tRNA(Asn)/Glu-tRNA(Gln) amidotransferase A subunit family amidase